jgi:WD40 repeat protein
MMVLEEKAKDLKQDFQCDAAAWSCRGRYAITSHSGKIEGEQTFEYSLIKIWDSFTNVVIQDLGRETDVVLKNFTFVLSPHPFHEHILLTGSDQGVICLWNIETRKCIKKFIEYGVFSIDRYTLNAPFDGKWTDDGQTFVLASQYGTLSLFNCQNSQHKYIATRVEQFMPLDMKMDGANLY